jgi:hypothetical protein
VFDEITKKPVNFNIATLNFPEGQKTPNSPPKKTKKEAIYFKKNQLLASLEDGKIFWEESVSNWDKGKTHNSVAKQNDAKQRHVGPSPQL